MIARTFKVIILFGILFQVLLIGSNTSVLAWSGTTTSKPSSKQFLSSQNPINITNNNQIVSYASSGDGSISSPYILENYVITTCTSSNIGINIENTNKYITLQYISISKCSIGISLINTTNIQVENSVLTSNSYGIVVSKSSFNTLFKINVSNNDVGINIGNESSNLIVNSNFIENNNDGLLSALISEIITPCLNSIFENNVVNNNIIGFYLQDFDYLSNNSYINNVASFNRYDGFLLYESIGNSTFINNTANSNIAYGFDIEESDYISLIGNNATANEGSGFYFGIDTKNNDIEKNTADQNLVGFNFVNCSNMFIIQNNASSNKHDGFDVFNVTNSILTNNTGLLNSWANLNLLNASNTTLTNNNFPINLPSEPQFLTTGYINNALQLKWEAPVTNGGDNITEYKIYRANNTLNYLLIGTSKSLSFVDTNIIYGEMMYYVVTAVNSAGEGRRSISIGVSIGGGSTVVFPGTGVSPLSGRSTSSKNQLILFSSLQSMDTIFTLIIVFIASISLVYLFISFRQYKSDNNAKKRSNFFTYLKNRLKKRTKPIKRISDPHEIDPALDKIEAILKENKE